MARIVLFVLLSIFSIYSFGQEYNDGIFVVHIMETDAQDLKCELGTTDRVNSLIGEGRYIISVVRTKFGTIILHKKGVSDVMQRYVHIPSFQFEKKAKTFFEEGYSVQSYNTMTNYGIFAKNPAIVKQNFLGQASEKKIRKQSKKGIYAILGSGTEDVGHNNIYGIASQEKRFYINAKQFQNDFKMMSEKGYIIGSVRTSFNKYGNYTFYTVLYDMPEKPYEGEQALGIFETKEEFTAFVNQNVNGKFSIKGIWGGWENRDYAAEEKALAEAAASSESGLDILLGLGNSIMQLTNAGQSTSDTYDDSSSNNSNSGTHSHGSSSKVGKCNYCGGTGNCSAKTSAGRKNACHGSGLCGHCSGTGWIKAGGSEAICTACNGKGKCKSCKGTGKCSHCRGTGK